MILTLESVSPRNMGPREVARHTFRHDGGSIGRDPKSSAWVLSDPKVSGRHAVISWRDSVFYVEDTSRNGTFLNSSRLTRGQPHPLSPGDTLRIDPYEIRVSIEGVREAAPFPPLRPAVQERPLPDDDPFGSASFDRLVPEPGTPVGEARLDPLELLNLAEPSPPLWRGPTADDLQGGDPFDFAYRLPRRHASSSTGPGARGTVGAEQRARTGDSSELQPAVRRVSGLASAVVCVVRAPAATRAGCPVRSATRAAPTGRAARGAGGEVAMLLTRREFLRQSGSCLGYALGVSAFAVGVQRFSLINALAQGADYRALVCVFLAGGNDGNNTVVPTTTTEYDQYAAARTSSDLAIPRGSLLSIAPPSTSSSFGLHPSLTELHALWNQQRMSVVCNVGPLVQPITREQYRSGVPRPYQPF
ncbi:MAG: FHA domain-containing protein [Acidimicrobiia bacterium]|nr:FHA domain-containing protein [Acidimicrobiia bacterium]